MIPAMGSSGARRGRTGRLGDRLAAMEKEIGKLTFLVEASKLLNSSLELDRLLEIIVDLAVRGTETERGTLYIVDQAKGELWSKVAQGPEMVEIRLPIGSGIAGHVAQSGEVVRIQDAYADARFNREVDRISGYRTCNILTVPMTNKHGVLIGVLQVLNRKGTFDDEDVSFLGVLQTHAAIAIENALLFKEALEKKRIDRELDLAADIQRKLLPAAPPRAAGLHLSALSEPCRQVGGDYFDFLTREGDLLGICIADVSGKGIPASLLMATLRASLRAQAESPARVAELVRRVNVALYKSSKPNQFASFFYGEVPADGARLTYVNAGHLPPMLRRAAGEIELLSGGGPLLGLREASPYEEVTVDLRPGDVVALYTDGVTDARSPDGDEFGEDRLRDLVSRVKGLPPDGALRRIMEEVVAFERGAPRTDDLTLILVERPAATA